MKAFALIVATLLSVAGDVQQQQPPKPTPEQIQAMMAELKPGPEHRVLANLEGKWASEMTFNMGGSQPKSMSARGTSTNRMILGGRFVISEYVADSAMGPAYGDVKVETVSIYGFDRRTKEYTTIGLDTMGTYYVTAAGTARPDKTIVMSGETLDDHSGSKGMRKYDMVLKVIDPDTYITQIIFKFTNMPDLKIVEVVHRRAK